MSTSQKWVGYCNKLGSVSIDLEEEDVAVRYSQFFPDDIVFFVEELEPKEWDFNEAAFIVRLLGSIKKEKGEEEAWMMKRPWVGR